MAEIQLKDLRHSYYPNPSRDEDYALSSVDLVWEEGLAYALLGPSGSGKTTMLNILSGLLTPSEGQVLFDGRDVTSLEARDRNIAQVFQFPVIYETMSVRQNLAFPLRTRGVSPDKTKKRVEFIADELGLTGLLDKRARALTAEQKQRISLGRGLVREDVSAILLDEPLTVIDPAEKMSLRRTLKAVQLHLGVKLIYVTHDQHEAMTLADRVVVMDDGEVVQVGTPEELFENPTHKFVGYFIGTPGMNFIPCSLDAGFLNIGNNRLTISSEAEAILSKYNGDLSVGVRPDFLSPSEQIAGKTIAGVINNVENHGDEKILSVESENFTLMARVHEDSTATPGESVHLRPESNSIRVFHGPKSIPLPPGSFGDCV